MHEECLICKAALEYLDADERMTCERCRKQFQSKTRCVNGHFICDACHTTSSDDIRSICLRSVSKNPIEIMEEMMSLPSCHMHGPEHHIMVGSALLAAYKNAGGAIDLEATLEEMQKRGQQVPGGVCGFWGACGAGISAGMFLAIALKSTPLAREEWGYSNQMTARVLNAIGKQGGPRCCKRNAYLSILEAVQFVREKLDVDMETSPISCSRSQMNNQCKKEACLFYPNASNETRCLS